MSVVIKSEKVNVNFNSTLCAYTARAHRACRYLDILHNNIMIICHHTYAYQHSKRHQRRLTVLRPVL